MTLGTIFVVLALFRHQALWILGPQYQNLSNELLIYFAGSAAACIGGRHWKLESCQSMGQLFVDLYSHFHCLECWAAFSS